MNILTLPKGDYGYRLVFECVYPDGTTPYALTGYTPHWKLWEPGKPGTVLIDKTLTILVAADGTCYYDVTSSDFTTITEYEAEVELQKTGAVESFEVFLVQVEYSG